MKNKILIVLGRTATGKSDLAVRLAKKYDGEIISADSRQVYRGLDLGTGKITKEEMSGIPHHLLDIADAKDRFTVAMWKKMADEKAVEILGRNHLPIICGGTGYYIQTFVDNITFPEIPNEDESDEFVSEYEGMNTENLWLELNKVDPARAATMTNNGEKQNRRRLIRAIYISKVLGKVPVVVKKPGTYDILQIGLNIEDDELRKRINQRLERRIEAGMIEEARRLHESGLSYERMRELGLEYRYMADLLENKLSKEEFTKTLKIKIWQYAKRQKTWFGRDKSISWFHFEEYEKICAEVEKFLGAPQM